MDISIFQIIGFAATAIGFTCVGAIWGHKIPFIKKLAE